jgi:hypothetical protein
MRFTYVRLFSDGSGDSHFEDVEVGFALTDFAPPAAPLHVASLGAASSLMLVGADSGWRGDEMHPAPARQFATSLSGEFEVTASDGTMRTFGPGDLVLLEDTSGKGHSSRCVSPQAFLPFIPAAD